MYTYDKNIEQKVLDLIGIGEAGYSELVFESGIQYLRSTSPDYPQVVSQIARSEVFWNWWRSHWQRRDEQFLEECESWVSTPEKYLQVYKNMNDGRTLQSAIYLNGQVLQEAYAEMIGKITKQQTEAA
ncbi:MAG: hypothetical protein ACT4OJ_14115 [Bacteroidota bacterium]